MEPASVRPATTDDADAIRRVAKRGWHGTYETLLAPATIEAAIAEWYSVESIRALIDSDEAIYLVAERGEDVLGYVSGGSSDESGVALLGAIYVDPDHWHEGIGTALLSTFEDACAARGYETITLSVLSGNEIAISFYRDQGFECVGEGETELFGEPVSEKTFRRAIHGASQ